MTVTSIPSRPSVRGWRRLGQLDAWRAGGWYALLTVVMTWPVCAHLASRVPSDLGDPLFASWLLQWNVDHLLALLRGDVGAITGYWNANIFHPEPLALLYAEHLFALGVQALPVWLVTHNVILCYNLIFLSTFALSGLGVFLLVRELTGNARAAFVAGLLYAFAPYRFAQLGHIQVLSSQWMPFVLFGFHRFFSRCESSDTPTLRPASGLFPPASAWRPLAGGALALVAQNLSCGYYLLFFAPVPPIYALWEVARRRLWRNRQMWTALVAAGAGVVAACLPFLLKYGELRGHGFAPRPLDELRAFSADTSAYLRGIDGAWLWGTGFTAYNKPEGQLFLGFVPLGLAVVALVCLAITLRHRSVSAEPLAGWRLAAAAPVAVAGIAALGLLRFELFAGRRIWRIREASPWLSDVRHVFLVVAACAAILLVLSPRARAFARLGLASSRALFAVMFCLAVWLSFGPLVTTYEHGIAADTLYGWLYRHVPGFDGLRVPARYVMLAVLALAVLGGYGAAAIDRGRRVGRWLLPALAVFFLLEAASMPLTVRRIEWPRRDGVAGAVSASDLDRLYSFVRNMPRDTVVAEFPFGTLQSETRAVFLATKHRHRILNGYSGGFPPGYDRRVSVLADPVMHGDAAWQALLDSGATCLIVHQWAFDGGNGAVVSDWLQSRGAIALATFKSDRLFQIPR